FFFITATPAPETYTLSLHDALPIFGLALFGQFGREGVAEVGQHLHVEGGVAEQFLAERAGRPVGRRVALLQVEAEHLLDQRAERSEEHTSELQSPYDLVCRLLLEKK